MGVKINFSVLWRPRLYNIIVLLENFVRCDAIEEVKLDIKFAHEQNLIPEKYRNSVDMTVIANVLLVGDMNASSQRYMFRGGDFKKFRKVNFSQVVNFAKILRMQVNGELPLMNYDDFNKSLSNFY